MPRPKTLLLAALAAAASVLILILARPQSMDPAPEESAIASTTPPEHTVDTGVAALTTGTQRSAAIEATTWTVVIIDEGGQSIANAQVVASQTGQPRLEAFGDTTWDGVTPGTWTLAVRADGRPLWRRDVTIEGGTQTRTRVQIGPGVLLDGRVRDTAGRACPGRIVGFMPRGARAPEAPALWLELPHTRSREDGSFRMLLPEAGDWRLFIGWGGKVAFEDRRPAALAPGGPSFVEVTVPSPTRLTAIVTDPPNMARLAAHGFSVYRRADLLAADRPNPNPTRPSPGGSTDPPETEDSVAEREAAEAAQVVVSNDAERKLRMAVVPEGFAKAKSGICNADGRITFERLPVGEALRFAVSRGAEAFAVDGEVILTAGVEVVVRLSLPAARPGGAPALSVPRQVLAAVEYLTHDGVLAPEGAVWR